MRNYIRHPTSIPIEVKTGEHLTNALKVKNLSAGGLSFITHESVKVGDVIEFKIPVVNPDYRGQGVVVWRRMQSPSVFEVGMRFTSNDEYFRTRMVEQVCQIEEYRQRINASDGRTINSEEAALEWIAKYAQSFDAED
jgi:hypothetical protein